MSNIEYLKTQTVLFVEDDDLARDVLAKILTKLFKRVITLFKLHNLTEILCI